MSTKVDPNQRAPDRTGANRPIDRGTIVVVSSAIPSRSVRSSCQTKQADLGAELFVEELLELERATARAAVGRIERAARESVAPVLR